MDLVKVVIELETLKFEEKVSQLIKNGYLIFNSGVNVNNNGEIQSYWAFLKKNSFTLKA